MPLACIATCKVKLNNFIYAYRIRAYIANGWANAIIDPDADGRNERSTDDQPDNETNKLDDRTSMLAVTIR